ncbi:MAG: tetratricopeptide repeat protein, partial [Bacteroidota bacterium]
FFFLLFISIFIHSQNSVVDSLEKVLTHSSDTQRIDILNKLIDNLMYSDTRKSLKYAEEAVSVSLKLKDNRRIMISSSNLGVILFDKGEADNALKYYKISLEASIKIQDSINIAKAYGNIGNVYVLSLNEPEAIKCYTKALTIFESLKNDKGIAISHGTMGNFYLKLSKWDNALESYCNAEKMFEKLGYKEGLATVYLNEGVVYKNKKDNEKAILFYTKAYKIFKELGYSRGTGQCLGNIGASYLAMKDYKNAINELSRAITIFHENNIYDEEVMSLINLGEAYQSMQRSDLALAYFEDAYSLAKKYDLKIAISSALINMFDIFKQSGDYKHALAIHEEYLLYHDSIYELAKEEKLNELLTQFETEKKESEIKLLKKNEKLQSLEIEKQNERMKRQITVIYLSVSVLIIILIFSLILGKQYRDKKKANQVLARQNTEILQQKEEIEAQRDEITTQRDEIEAQRDEVERQRNIAINQRDEIKKQKKDITDSIEYAKNIQHALLLNEHEIKKIIPDSFCLFLPRDIVSGDFYWLAKIENKTVVAVADCTGHGVPGAFVSIIGINHLQEIVNQKKITEPEEILSELRKNIIKSFAHAPDSDHIDTKDGMDISICIFDIEKMKLEFAGAHNHLVIIQNDELKVVKADLMPVGHSPKENIPFTRHDIDLNKGDMIYMSSDGFVDQFGSLNNQKIKSKNYKKLLLSTYNYPCNQQKSELLDAFNEWKGDLEQVDDIIIFGIRI